MFTPRPGSRVAECSSPVRNATTASATTSGIRLAELEPGLLLGGGPVIRPRYRRVPDKIWVADLEPDLTHLQEIDPDDAKTRCSFVAGHFPAGVTWAAPQNTWREAKREWPPDIWQRQPGHDDVLLHPAVRAVMIFCTAAPSHGAAVSYPGVLASWYDGAG